MQVTVLACIITTKTYSLSELSRWSVRGWYILEKVWLMPGQEGQFKLQQRFISEWKKIKRWGNVSFWGSHGKILLAPHIWFPVNSWHLQGKKKRNFCHRLGACYNLGIYIHMLLSFSSLVCTPSLIAVQCSGTTPLWWEGSCGGVQEWGERCILCW